MKNISFEESLIKVNKIIEELESGELTLDSSISSYADAMKLITGCHAMLDKAEGKIKKIIEDKNNIKTEDYE